MDWQERLRSPRLWLEGSHLVENNHCTNKLLLILILRKCLWRRNWKRSQCYFFVVCEIGKLYLASRSHNSQYFWPIWFCGRNLSQLSRTELATLFFCVISLTLSKNIVSDCIGYFESYARASQFSKRDSLYEELRQAGQLQLISQTPKMGREHNGDNGEQMGAEWWPSLISGYITCKQTWENEKNGHFAENMT